MPTCTAKVLVALGFAAGLVRTAAAAEPIDAVCAKAVSDPTLTWYSSQEETRNEAALGAFRVRYPKVRVESLRLVTGKLAARYAAERSAGVNNAGLITLGDPVFIVQGQKAGWFVDFPQADMPALTTLDPRWFDHGAATSTISLLGISYNTDQVGKDAPKTWTDLLNPKWKGRLLLGDPRSVPSYMALARIWQEKYGDEFLSKLAAQEAKVCFLPLSTQSSQSATVKSYREEFRTPLGVRKSPKDEPAGRWWSLWGFRV